MEEEEGCSQPNNVIDLHNNLVDVNPQLKNNLCKNCGSVSGSLEPKKKIKDNNMNETNEKGRNPGRLEEDEHETIKMILNSTKEETKPVLKRHKPVKPRKRILPAMEVLVERDPNLHIFKQDNPVAKTMSWFSRRHQSSLHLLEVFPDKQTNECLKSLLQLPSSKMSLMLVAANLISIFWKERDYKHLSSQLCLEDKRFQQVWSFVIQNHPNRDKQKRVMKALKFLQTQQSA